MDPRLNIERAQQEQREIHRKARRRWPDDGLPPRHKRARPSPNLSSASLIGELFWR